MKVRGVKIDTLIVVVYRSTNSILNDVKDSGLLEGLMINPVLIYKVCRM